jgi:hypothetical protein
MVLIPANELAANDATMLFFLFREAGRGLDLAHVGIA